MKSYNYKDDKVNNDIEYLNKNANIISSNNRLILYKYIGKLP